MKTQRKAAAIAVITVLIIMLLCMCGCMNKNAAHTDHADDEGSKYGTGNYLYSSVTVTGTGMGKEKICSVKDIEETAYENSDIGYSGKYSLLTSGGVFSKRTFTGARLYEFLVDQGMSKNLDKNTPVTIVSTDGYSKTILISEIKKNKYNYYSTMDAKKTRGKRVPVLLSFGSDNVPLVGPTGSQKIGKKITEKDGYVKDADNIGGPVRLTIGQIDPQQYNAPDNVKWVSKIIVGKKKNYTQHSKKESEEKTVKISVYDKDANNKRLSSSWCTIADVEKYAAKKTGNCIRNYYGEKNFYEGAYLWGYIKEKADLAAQEGKVKFSFADGSSETIDMEYLRNLSGDSEDYTTKKSGKTITGTMPALAYSIDGEPTEKGRIYAILPAKKDIKKGTTKKECISIDIYAGKKLSDNPNAEKTITIKGKGIQTNITYSVAELENMPDITKTVKGYTGVAVYDLLQDAGMTVDAYSVTFENDNETIKLKLNSLKDGNHIIATRKNGKALSDKEGSVCLAGVVKLNELDSMNVGIHKGQWTHSKGDYRKYLDTKLKISGSAVEGKTYKLSEIEALTGKNTVRQSFAASAGSNGYQGAVLKKLITKNLKKGIKTPAGITVIGQDGYKKEIPVDDVWNGIDSRYQEGQHRDIILAYSIDGVPLVPTKKSEGYNGSNGFGPLRLIVENQVSGWVKNVKEISVSK